MNYDTMLDGNLRTEPSLCIIKRSGKRVPFEKEKIANAIMRGNESIEEKNQIAEDEISAITDAVTEKCCIKASAGEEITVEYIQDMVCEELMNRRFYKLAAHYIAYRHEHALIRAAEKQKADEDAISEKLNASNVQNQNANLDEHSFSGRMNEATRVITKEYALDHCMSEMAKNNHLNNEIYIHDLDSYAVGMHNCLSIPFDRILASGFKTRQTDVRSPRSVNTAMQLVAVIMQLQSLQQFGGVSATHLDWTMIPYVRYSFYKHFNDGLAWAEDDPVDAGKLGFSKEEAKDVSIDDPRYKSHAKAYAYAMAMTERETHQAVEAMYHNLNTLQSRSGQQLPFSSINYGTCTLPEGRMVTKELLNVSIEGLGKLHRTPIFPCGIFQCMKGVNRKPGDPNYDLLRLALESTSKRLYPNYCNVDWSNNAGYDRNDPNTYVSTMGCRTYNGADINADPGVNPQLKDGRGNLAPVTIIMPTLAMEAKEAAEKNGTNIIDEFMSILDKKLHEARDMLLERYELMCSQSPSSAAFMWENRTMNGYDPKIGPRSALKHGTLAIGQLGLAETLQILAGCDQTSSEGMALAEKIEQLFKDRCAQFKQEEHLNFGVYYTPAENLCKTAMSKFKAKYGVIPHVSENKYFTNSIHVPVWEEMTPFEKIDIESKLTGYSNAGCITYVELESSSKHNIDAMEDLVNYAMDKDIPYFAINVPNDTCEDCGYTDEMNDTCPVCGGHHITHLRRVTGYLTGDYKRAFNTGKQQEAEMRVKHNHIYK